MKIISYENDSYIILNLDNTDEYYKSFTLEASINIGHGLFSAVNNDIHFSNLENFVNSFDKFISDRRITCNLEGTYDSFIKIYDVKNTVIIDFCIGDVFCGNQTYNYKLYGNFTLDQNHLPGYLEQFHKILTLGQ